jgi:hypothetical protein
MSFPSLPVDGQIVIVNNISYTYDLANESWYRSGQTSANLILTDTANIVSTLSSTSTTTGALRVAGGVGVQGNVVAGAVYTDSYFYANGTAFVGGAGTTGYTGSAGSGFTGSAGTGYTGSSGTNGYTGSAGTNGYTGSAGTNGYTGSVGAGYTGSAGVDGYAGSFGYTGSAGSNGYVGSAGVDGYTGSIGSLGYTGSSGTGYTGSAGAAAAIGYTGSAGPTGTAGTNGAAGAPGIATSSLAVDNFTGSGSQTAFTLSVLPSGINQTLVIIDGVAQLRESYTLLGTTLTFTEAPANGAKIEVTVFVYGTTSFVNRSYTGNGSATTYTITSGVTENSIIVTDNGVMQRPVTDYTVSGSTITFSTPPSNGANIQIREIPSGTVGYTGSVGVGYTGSAGTGSGSTGDSLSPFLLMGG